MESPNSSSSPLFKAGGIVMTLSITDELNVTGKFMFEDNAKRDAIDQVRTLSFFLLWLALKLALVPFVEADLQA